jgi:N-acetylglucosamine kinase-like BadF-type ATPase
VVHPTAASRLVSTIGGAESNTLTKLFLGVDGGQSSTTALIGDETGRILGAGRGGPCNHIGAAEGAAKLTRAVEECVAKACEQTHLDPRQIRFAAACFGMSGGPDDKESLLSQILSTEKLIVTHDGLIALSGATAGDPGIIVIAGTGSFAFGRNAGGQAMRAGGWGYIFGDEGSGFDITRQALRAALRFEEGWGPPTALREVLLEASDATDANDTLHRFYTREFPRSRVATFSQLVDQTAIHGDQVAIDILMNAAQQLASFAASIWRQLWKEGESARVAYIGGVFQSKLLLERFRQLVEIEDGNHCQPPEYGPAAGALLEAYRAAGLHPKLTDLLSSEY